MHAATLRPMPDEWYRAWRHEERAREARMAWDSRFRRREAVKRVLGEAFLIGAIVMFAWSTFG